MGIEAKLGLILAILTAAIGFWQWDRGQAYDHGYADRVVEEKKATDTRVADIQTIAKEEIDKAVHESGYWKEVAIKLQQEKPKTKTEIVYVDSIKKNNPNCTKLIGSSVLWNDLADRYK